MEQEEHTPHPRREGGISAMRKIVIHPNEYWTAEPCMTEIRSKTHSERQPKRKIS